MQSYRYVDMHCHILPAVDDGSQSMEMSLNMARIAAGSNIGTIIVTPHNYAAHRSVSPDGIRRRVRELQQACDEEGIGIVFYPGNELYYDSSLPERLYIGEALTLADTEYCLVEFNPSDPYSYITEGLRALIYEGYRPILAHCERYMCLVEDPSRAEEIHRSGVLLQCNAEMVPAKLFQKIPAFVNGLLKKELVSFIATDAHRDSGGRIPDLTKAAAYLNKKYDADYVRHLLGGNAENLLLAGNDYF